MEQWMRCLCGIVPSRHACRIRKVLLSKSAYTQMHVRFGLRHAGRLRCHCNMAAPSPSPSTRDPHAQPTPAAPIPLHGYTSSAGTSTSASAIASTGTGHQQLSTTWHRRTGSAAALQQATRPSHAMALAQHAAPLYSIPSPELPHASPQPAAGPGNSRARPRVAPWAVSVTVSWPARQRSACEPVIDV